MNAEEPADDLRIPRAQVGSSPQHLLATLLGEYLDSSDAGLPSAAVIAILAEFGVSESSARAALSRLVKRGLIATRGTGRPPVYHLTPAAIARHRSRMRHFLNFGARPPQWSGQWLMVSFSIPSPGQASRHAVRRALSALRFVGLYDSVWIRPGSDAEPVKRALDESLHHVPGARWSVIGFLPWILRRCGRGGNGTPAEQGRESRSAARADRRPPHTPPHGSRPNR
ncbi:hypothetical protein [Micromonospora sp. Llam0]|uniref:hypothetical protein n=1 Tax=Micromonospora sp. Llam0 TaxID=2485143 RepID=UPI001F227363|nr:hypothetical protein [Micromonospora sp. Llam0]